MEQLGRLRIRPLARTPMAYLLGRDPRSAHASVLEYNDLGRVLAGQ